MISQEPRGGRERERGEKVGERGREKEGGREREGERGRERDYYILTAASVLLCRCRKEKK